MTPTSPTTMPRDSFKLLDPQKQSNADRKQRQRWLAERSALGPLRSHAKGAEHFQPSPELVTAINIALSVQAPLLLTGEPGTGKTQVAYYLAWYFELDLPYRLDVRSATTVSDLLYRFDTVAYFHAAQDPARGGEVLDRARFIDKGPLWRAFDSEAPAVVLIDEIDKAPRDFPNDLLNVLDQHEFYVPEHPDEDQRTVRLSEGKPPPLVVITSNSERRLPEPFLRRCIFHHIEFTPAILDKAVAAYTRAGLFAQLEQDLIAVAVERFLELRRLPLRKKPATAEFLVWLSVLSAKAQGRLDRKRLKGPLRELPGLAALIKDRDDLARL